MLQASVAAALLSAATVHAAVIDFDAASVSHLSYGSLPYPLSLVNVYHGTSYTEEGFTLTSSHGGLLNSLFVPDAANRLYRPAADSLAMSATANDTITLTASDHSAFNANSIALSKLLLLGGSVTFYGVKADHSATVHQTFSYTGTWTTFNFDATKFTGLSALSWQQGPVAGGKFEFDNINVSAVPEPASYAMLLGGLGLVGWARRRKQA